MGTAASLRLPHTWDMSRWLPKGFRNLQRVQHKKHPHEMCLEDIPKLDTSQKHWLDFLMDHHGSSLMQLMKELSSFPSSGRAQHIQEEEPDQNHWHLNKDTLCCTVCPRMVCTIVHTSHFMAMSRGKIMINIGSNID